LSFITITYHTLYTTFKCLLILKCMFWLK
jgi:hypothetical protein